MQGQQYFVEVKHGAERDGNLRRTERSTVTATCGVQLKDMKRSMDLMFMLDLKAIYISYIYHI